MAGNSEQPTRSADAIDASEVTVVIPAFNEAGRIAEVVRELREAIPGIGVLVVDDGSSDATGPIALQAGAKVVVHRRNRGYGAALKTGIQTVSTPYVALYDADGQHRPQDLREMLAVGRQADLVIGARDRNSFRQMDRRPGKWLLGRVANLLTGQKIPDLNSGLRVMRRSVILRYLHLLPNGFSASTTTTICMFQRGYDVKFVPVTVRRRAEGKSTVRKFRDGLNTIRLMVRLIILFSPERFFLPPAVTMIALGAAYGLYKAMVHRQGIPTLAVLVIVTGLITGLFGLLADQISTLRIELFERDQPEDR
jgi:glycosyltransferase involved in cell wall biosynthesis